MLIVRNKFELTNIVYLITDSQQLKRIVTGIIIRANDVIMYELSCGTDSSWHHEFELSAEKDTVMAVT